MRQETFVQRHQAEWIALEQWLDARGGSARKARAHRRDWHGLRDHEMPERYRRLCQQLALARRRGYSAVVTDRLQQLMQRGHGVLYRTPAPRWRRAVEFLLAGFPRLVRAEKGAMLAATVLFVVPLLAMYVAIQLQPDLSSALYDPVQLANFEQMYDPADPNRALGRDDGTDVAMFGFYIWNNISIAFRVFASGLLAGLGPILSLGSEGIRAGAVASHLQAVGHGDPFWRFVCGHAAFELTAIVIAGGAGLRLGLNLIAPGQRRRVDALVEAGRRGGLLCVGVFVMLLIAAFIEAFWSSIGWMPAWIKYSVAAALWTAVFMWLLAGGRNRLYADEDAAASGAGGA
ncbi:stage II sporulation protein M [Lysobacter yangpyeongensis]|uniref:Stage II sporulation protein M n=1 Tax=Lysobacter yangpyeongensis TaxID=346182 RepID=A0ABW0SNB0_9GAMM